MRATHDFITEADLEVFRPLVRAALPELTVRCVRSSSGEAVGFAGVDSDKLEMLFVHPDYRGTGVTAVDVNEQNEQALGFYLKLGFEVAGRSERDGTGMLYPLLHLRLRLQELLNSNPKEDR